MLKYFSHNGNEKIEEKETPEDFFGDFTTTSQMISISRRFATV
jgi:hypothetical protein